MIESLDALRAVGSTGSPLPASGFRWVQDGVGRQPGGVDMWGTDVVTGWLQRSRCSRDLYKLARPATDFGVLRRNVSARGVQLVATVTALPENAAADQYAQQAAQRIGVCVDRAAKSSAPSGPSASASAIPRSTVAVIACAAQAFISMSMIAAYGGTVR
jgi:hypothetical protein